MKKKITRLTLKKKICSSYNFQLLCIEIQIFCFFLRCGLLSIVKQLFQMRPLPRSADRRRHRLSKRRRLCNEKALLQRRRMLSSRRHRIRLRTLSVENDGRRTDVCPSAGQGVRRPTGRLSKRRDESMFRKVDVSRHQRRKRHLRRVPERLQRRRRQMYARQ